MTNPKNDELHTFVLNIRNCISKIKRIIMGNTKIDQYWYNEKGQRHREGGPAIIDKKRCTKMVFIWY